MDKIPQLSDSLYAFYWIRGSGIVQYSWYASPEFKSKWGEDEILLSGFLIALNAIGQVIFDKSHLRHITFDRFKLGFQNVNGSGDILAVICNATDFEEKIDAILTRMSDYIEKSPYNEEYVNTRWNETINESFLQLLREFTDETLPMSPLPTTEIAKFPLSSEVHINKQESAKSIMMLGQTMGNTFNNILSIILGNISLIKLDNGLNSSQQTCLEEAEQSCNRAKMLTSVLFSISKNMQVIQKPLKEKV